MDVSGIRECFLQCRRSLSAIDDNTASYLCYRELVTSLASCQDWMQAVLEVACDTIRLGRLLVMHCSLLPSFGFDASNHSAGCFERVFVRILSYAIDVPTDSQLARVYEVERGVTLFVRFSFTVMHQLWKRQRLVTRFHGAKKRNSHLVEFCRGPKKCLNFSIWKKKKKAWIKIKN